MCQYVLDADAIDVFYWYVQWGYRKMHFLAK